jgi:hypothetical protein
VCAPGGTPTVSPASAAAAAAAARMAKDGGSRAGSPDPAQDVKGKRPAQPLDISPGT